PLTPGGVGFVEAGLTGALPVAGASATAAVLATLVYRLFSYWLPLPAGAIASTLFARRRRAVKATNS
ncbi:MAG: putative heme transporter, partial [Actinomycetota bacterium]|nr:putative heme transporter [Actinomycetota bacterium]